MKETHVALSAERAQAIMRCLDALAEAEDIDAQWYMQADSDGGWGVYLAYDGALYRVVPEDETNDDPDNLF